MSDMRLFDTKGNRLYLTMPELAGVMFTALPCSLCWAVKQNYAIRFNFGCPSSERRHTASYHNAW